MMLRCRFSDADTMPEAPSAWLDQLRGRRREAGGQLEGAYQKKYGYYYRLEAKGYQLVVLFSVGHFLCSFKTDQKNNLQD